MQTYHVSFNKVYFIWKYLIYLYVYYPFIWEKQPENKTDDIDIRK